MAVDPGAIAAALRLPRETPVSLVPLTAPGSSLEIATIGGAEGARRSVAVRAYSAPEPGENNAAVLEALARIGYLHSVRLLGAGAGFVVEEAPAGRPAVALRVERGDALRAVEALAALHGSGLREGLRWERNPAELLSPGELPLFRLGFTSSEREAAREPARRIGEALQAWAGPVHGNPVATNVYIEPGRAVLTDWATAGYGLQVFDLAAFILTAGLDAGLRHEVACHYALLRAEPAEELAGLADAAGLLWGLRYLMDVPSREIELLGDDAALGWVRLMARRVSQAIQEPSSRHPLALALRRALWPG